MDSSTSAAAPPPVSEKTYWKDDGSTIKLPALEHGYRDVPMEWPELTRIVEQREWSKLTRSIEQQRTYEIFKLHAKRRWKSLHDYL
jgi:hypothetical protein